MYDKFGHLFYFTYCYTICVKIFPETNAEVVGLLICDTNNPSN